MVLTLNLCFHYGFLRERANYKVIEIKYEREIDYGNQLCGTISHSYLTSKSNILLSVYLLFYNELWGIKWIPVLLLFFIESCVNISKSREESIGLLLNV